MIASVAFVSRRFVIYTPNGNKLKMTHIESIKSISELLVLLFVFIYLFIIGKRLLEDAKKVEHRQQNQNQNQQQQQQQSLHNLLYDAPELIVFTSTCLLILICLPLRYFHLSELEDLLASIIMFLLPLKLLFFCRATKSLGSFIVMIYKILVNDVLCFVVFLIIFVAGFSQSFYIIFKTHQSNKMLLLTTTTTTLAPGTTTTNNLNINNNDIGSKNYFVNLFDGVIAMHMMALNEFSLVLDGFDQTDYPILARLLFCIYMILVSILLINMLIAMLGKTYQDISSQPNESVRQWARALLTVERMCSPKRRLNMLDRYSEELSITSQANEKTKIRIYSSTRSIPKRDNPMIDAHKRMRRENETNLQRNSQAARKIDIQIDHEISAATNNK